MNRYQPQSVTHPSEILNEALEERKMGSKEFAVKTGKPEKTVSALLKGKSAITSEMAILFEKVLNIPAHFWLEAQRNYDEYAARVKYQKEIDNAKEWAQSFPYPQMANFGWVEKTRKPEKKVNNLFNFFGIASKKGFEDYYLNQKTQVAFRISLKSQDNANAIAAWLRKGEIDAQQIDAPTYNASKFKRELNAIKAIMAKHSSDFFDELQELCKSCGVKVLYTPNLSNAPIHGSTRWLNGSPLIQLSGRYKRNDIFWFTFFHEAAHILKHGSKYISIENIDIEGEVEEYENEANEFAAEWILSKKEEEEILNHNRLSKQDVIDYAEKFGTHPACIIGRLQYRKMIPHGIGNDLFESIEFSDN